MSGLYMAVAIAQVCMLGPLLFRLGRGPSVSDRMVALNTMATEAALALLFFSAWADRTVYLDVAVWLASFSYLGTIVWSRYVEREML